MFTRSDPPDLRAENTSPDISHCDAARRAIRNQIVKRNLPPSRYLFVIKPCNLNRSRRREIARRDKQSDAKSMSRPIQCQVRRNLNRGVIRGTRNWIQACLPGRNMENDASGKRLPSNERSNMEIDETCRLMSRELFAENRARSPRKLRLPQTSTARPRNIDACR